MLHADLEDQRGITGKGGPGVCWEVRETNLKMTGSLTVKCLYLKA